MKTIKFTFLFFILLLGCQKEFVSKETTAAPLGKDFINCEPETIIVNDDMNADMVAYDSTYLIFQASKLADSIQVGSILLSGPTTDLPGGYLVKVVNIEPLGSDVKLHTEYATFDEAFSSYQITMRFDANTADFVGDNARAKVKKKLGKFCEVGVGLSADSYVDFDIDVGVVDFAVTKNEAGEINYLKTFVNTPTFKFETLFEGDGFIDLKCSKAFIDNVAFPPGNLGDGKYVTFFIPSTPPIPVVLCLDFVAKVNVTAKANLNGEIGYKGDFQYSPFFEYFDPKNQADNEFEFGGDFIPNVEPIGDGTLSGSITVDFTIDIKMRPYCTSFAAVLRFIPASAKLSADVNGLTDLDNCKLTLQFSDLELFIEKGFFGDMKIETDKISLLPDALDEFLDRVYPLPWCDEFEGELPDVISEYTIRPFCEDGVSKVGVLFDPGHAGFYRLEIDDVSLGSIPIGEEKVYEIPGDNRRHLLYVIDDQSGNQYGRPLFNDPCLIEECFADVLLVPYCSNGATRLSLRILQNSSSRHQFSISVGDGDIEFLDYNMDHDILIGSDNSTLVVIQDVEDETCRFEEVVLSPCEGCRSITDPRDQEEYCTVTIGGKRWFAENLRYAGSDSGIKNVNSQHAHEFGQYYTWNEVSGKQLCPAGWRIPTRQEWLNMINSDTDIYQGGALKGLGAWAQPNTGAMNLRKFNVFPNGLYSTWDNTYQGISREANFWTSTPYTEEGAQFSAHSVQFLHNSARVDFEYAVKDIAYACRCIEN